MTNLDTSKPTGGLRPLSFLKKYAVHMLVGGLIVSIKLDAFDKLIVPLVISYLRQYSVFIFVGLLALRLLHNKFRRAGLHSIPGPTVAAYTALWKVVDVWKGSAHRTHIRLHEKHGPLVRLGPNHISIGDPKAIPIIYGLKTTFYKSHFYPIQSISWNKRPQCNLFSNTNPEAHREQKRLFGHTYSLTSILESEKQVDTCTALFTKKLDAQAGKPVDLGNWLQYYAFDVVGELVFAQKLGFLQKGADVDGMMAAIQGILIYASRCGQVPEAHPLLLGNPLFPILIPAMEKWNSVVTFTLKAINESRASLERDGELKFLDEVDGKDMLSRLTRAKEASPERYNTENIMVHLSGNVFAGSDTTSIALRAIVYFLLRNPEKMAKAVAEIDNADAEGKLSPAVSYRESIEHLPYMQAVMNEAMRLHPSVGLILERTVPEAGLTVCDKFIPAGTVVGVNAWVVHRDPSIFPEPEAFKPERWLEISKEQLKVMNSTMFQFGSGTRACLGKHVSLMEMSKVIPQLLREYEITLTHPEKEWKVTNMWFVQQEGLICNLKRRRSPMLY